MKQFEFEIINKKTKRIEHARATAKTDEIARAQIVLVYGDQFDIAGLYCNVNPAHHIIGEIDCSGFPVKDMAWLMCEAAKVEGVTP